MTPYICFYTSWFLIHQTLAYSEAEVDVFLEFSVSVKESPVEA